MNGRQLSKILNIKSKHALYSKDGKWYHHLTAFPGVLFDKNGYLLFYKKSGYQQNAYLQLKNDLNIKDGISSIKGYKEFSKEQIRKVKQLNLSKNKKKSSISNVKSQLHRSDFKEKKDFVFTPGSPYDIISISRSKKSEPVSKEISKLHREISKGLYDFLLETSGKNNLSCDRPTGHGTFIDMVQKTGNSYIFYEIKTYRDLRKSIREAFGQLMEYAYWSCEGLAKQLVIVTHQTPDQNVINYFKFIRKEFHIPIFYQQFDLKRKKLLRRF